VKRLRDRRIGDRVGNGRLHQAGDGDNVPGFGLLDGDSLEAAEGEHLGGSAFLDDVAVNVDRLDRHVDVETAAFDPPGQDAPEERVAIQQRREHLELAFGIETRRRHMADDRLEQRGQVARADVIGEPGIARATRRVEHRKIELLVGRVEIEKQFEHLVEHFGRTRVRAVDLVDDDDGPEPERQRLSRNELGLRHRTFGRIDQKDHTVDHREDALDLRAEIGVARRIDDVDVRDFARGIRPFDRGALGEDGDPAFFFQVVRIHRALFHALVVAERAGLAEQLVDKRRLAVIDVGDDRHVAQIHWNVLKN
jgi:hypothetical protein